MIDAAHRWGGDILVKYPDVTNVGKLRSGRSAA